MKGRITATELRDVATRQLVEAWVVPVSAVHEFRMVAERWHASKAALRRVRRQSGVELPANDAWDWADKAAVTTPGSHQFFGVRTDEMQGMMMLATVPQPSRRPGHEDELLIYIEYLESAPWNLPEYAGEVTRYRGVGFSLLNAAVATSLELGCGGRLGLHSLPGARPFYERAGFQRIGFDESEKLDWFERGGVSIEKGAANEPAESHRGRASRA